MLLFTPFHSALWRLKCERSTHACTHKSAYVNHNNNSIKVRTNLNRKCVRVEGEPRALAFHSCTSKLKVEITLINRSSISGLMNLFHISNYATILQLRNAKVLQFLNDHLDIPKYTYLQIFMLNVFSRHKPNGKKCVYSQNSTIMIKLYRAFVRFK